MSAAILRPDVEESALFQILLNLLLGLQDGVFTS